MSVSIVIPTFRRPEMLARLLASIAAQTYQRYEVIVVDDGSALSDYAPVLAAMRPRLPRLTFLRNDSNRGACYCRNRGIFQAQHTLIALVDDDDEWLPHKLERQVQAFAEAPASVGLVYTWTDVVENGVRTPLYRATIEGRSLPRLLGECFIPSPSVMARRAALFEAGLFDETLPSCQDWDMWTRILACGYEARVVPEVLALYHKHGAPSVGTSPRARAGYTRYYRKHFWKLVRFGQWRHLARYARLTVGV
ncbi:MAG TPA: glycosyltransferase family A protein [Steroidobacteraceae bacterium]|nr:glycosyltransferase family A protein [Steroidobacteraceae bacterium]